MALKVYGASTQDIEDGSIENRSIENGSIQNRGDGLRRSDPRNRHMFCSSARRANRRALISPAGLGLDPALIEDARGRLSTSERDIAGFLSEMHRRLTELESDRRVMAEREGILAAREKSLEEGWEKKFAGEDSRDRGQASRGRRAIGPIRAARAGDDRRLEPEGSGEDREDEPGVSRIGGGSRRAGAAGSGEHRTAARCVFGRRGAGSRLSGIRQLRDDSAPHGATG